MRIAVDQLRRSGGPADRRTDVAVEVMGAETERLDQLAKEFAEFGRLPEGPKSEVDLVDLLVDLGQSAVPSEVDVSVRANGEPCKLLGHYDPCGARSRTCCATPRRRWEGAGRSRSGDPDGNGSR